MARSYGKAVRDGLFVAGIAGLVVIVGGAYVAGSYAPDAAAYWQAAHGPMYLHPEVWSPLAYLYSPAFIQVLWPLLALPYPAFLAAWYAISSISLVFISRWLLPLVLLTAVVPTVIIHGNIEVLLALAIVVGFRYPSAWAFVLISKVAPGVGLLWFAVRREWRHLAIALGTTALIVVVSFVIAPGLWFEYIGHLIDNAQVNLAWPYLPIPLVVRLPIAAAVVAYGATRDWRWTVPLAATIAMPVLWPVNMTVLVGVIPLARRPAGLAKPTLSEAPAAA